MSGSLHDHPFPASKSSPGSISPGPHPMLRVAVFFVTKSAKAGHCLKRLPRLGSISWRSGCLLSESNLIELISNALATVRMVNATTYEVYKAHRPELPHRDFLQAHFEMTRIQNFICVLFF